MLTLIDDIRMTMQEIDKLNKELEQMDPKLPENRFRYANKKSEVNILYKKLYELRERQKFEKKESQKIDFSSLKRTTLVTDEEEKKLNDGIKRKILRKP